MKFCEVRNRLKKNFEELIEDKSHLFSVDLDKDRLYDLYLDSFPSGTNEIFRERREHDCSCCRQFIKNIGNVVSIKDGCIKTIWDFEAESNVYTPVFKEMDKFVRSKTVTDIYLSDVKRVGTKEDFELMDDGTSYRWTHFYLDLPDKFVMRKDSIPAKLGRYRDSKSVFKRSLEEIALEALDIVIELSESNTLYKGQEWLNILKEFRKHKKEFEKLQTDREKDLCTWEKSVDLPESLIRIRNTSIGTLLVNISEGKSIDDAVRAYEVITAPSNYKRSKPIFTQKMLDEAQNKINNMGYTDSLPRRFSVLGDITINDVLFANKNVVNKLKSGLDIFSELSKNTKSNSKKFLNIEEISVDKFIKDVLPSVSEIEVYLENKHLTNMVSLISPQNENSKSMFKWGNNYSWAYSGNMTDSMKERVKSAGGKVDGDLRFSIQWNECGRDDCDLDAHCKTPSSHIYYGNKTDRIGELDIDIRTPGKNIAVENITWADRNKMKDGTYIMYVHQFERTLVNGFKAEIEFDGVIHSFEYPHLLKTGDKVKVAEVILSKGNFTIKPLLNSKETSKEIWNLKTNTFIPVTVMCYSPNHWETVENKVGHKHLFFMLQDCINNENPSGIFNEFLVQELYEHRKVMEAIGNKMRVEDSENQLSGIGFALDKRNDLVIRVKGSVERIIKIKF